MPPDPIAAGSAEDWLRHAKSDLALASKVSPGDDVLAETLCFHAQKAAEKAIKAVLVRLGAEFPRTHSVRLLVDLLPTAIRDDAALEPAVALTDYAVTTRYPGENEAVGQDELQEAIHLARAVIRWAESQIRSSPPEVTNAQ